MATGNRLWKVEMARIADEQEPWCIPLPEVSTVADLERAVKDRENTRRQDTGEPAVVLDVRVEFEGEPCRVSPKDILRDYASSKFVAVRKGSGGAAPRTASQVGSAALSAATVVGEGGASDGASAGRPAATPVVPASPPFSASSSSSAQLSLPPSAPRVSRGPPPPLPSAHCTAGAAPTTSASKGSSAVAAASNIPGGKTKAEVMSDDGDDVVCFEGSCKKPPRKKARAALPSQPGPASSPRLPSPGPSAAATTARSAVPSSRSVKGEDDEVDVKWLGTLYSTGAAVSSPSLPSPSLAGQGRVASPASPSAKAGRKTTDDGRDMQAKVNSRVDAVAEAASCSLPPMPLPSIPAAESSPRAASWPVNPSAAMPVAMATPPRQPVSGTSITRKGPEGASSDRQQPEVPRPSSANKAAAGAAAASGASPAALGGALSSSTPLPSPRFVGQGPVASPASLSAMAGGETAEDGRDKQANVNNREDAVSKAASSSLPPIPPPSMPAMESSPHAASWSVNPSAAMPDAVATLPQRPISGTSMAREGAEGASGDRQQPQVPRPSNANEAAAGAAAPPGASPAAVGSTVSDIGGWEQASPFGRRAAAASAGEVEAAADGVFPEWSFTTQRIRREEEAAAAYYAVEAFVPVARALTQTRAAPSPSAAVEGEAKNYTRCVKKSLQRKATNPLSKVNMTDPWQCAHSLAFTAAMLHCGTPEQRKYPEALLRELGSGDIDTYSRLRSSLWKTAETIKDTNEVDVDPRALEEVCKTEEAFKNYIIPADGIDGPKAVHHAFKALVINCEKRNEYKDPICQLGIETDVVCEEGRKPKEIDFFHWPRCEGAPSKGRKGWGWKGEPRR